MVKFGLGVAAFGFLGMLFTSGDAYAPPGSGFLFFLFFAVGTIMATNPVWYRLWLRHRALR
jgi:hypothetical protein